ncbi:MAG: putative ABC transporter ATP-binding protein [Anaerolinea thermophila]|uniref:Putative ABC transporter ATP-binding protein n=1 Tax=Anaerolinea thermophila TaxID=167964 RepID=A0A101FYK6_9CHLR|nr:MAG: putative ABC transporter ATP-binding protein [Anaerolinea thermophila]
MSKPVINIKNVTKTYKMGEIEVHALRGISFDVQKGEVISIMGPSGSGKSTLMNIIGCLDHLTTGEYNLDGKDIANLDDDELAQIRNQKVGFVFQNFNLLARSTALSNVELPLRYAGQIENRLQLAEKALTSVGLEDRIHHKPSELSGGQQQRVAIARAIINNPAIILADEPTGNLDSKSGDEIMELLLGLNKKNGTTLIIVTHDPQIASHTRRTIQLFDGLIQERES